jgi:hypothetical protein
METRVLAAVAAGRGLVTATQLSILGFHPRRVARWVRSGELVSVRRGVYTTAQLWSEWDEFRARPIARVRAEHLTLTVPHVFSHDSAALLLGLPLIWPQAAEVHVTRRRVHGSRIQYGVRHHGAAYPTRAVVVVDGLPALDIARTVVDLARTHGYRAGLVGADGALQLGVPRAELAAAYASMRCWPGVTSARSAVDDADPGAESVGETLTRELVAELGLGPIETQFPVLVGGGLHWCDMRVGCHLFEFDGRIKFRSIGMSRLTWNDFWGAARERAKRRLLAEYAVTEARFGRSLPARLEDSARRFRGRRYRTPA